MPVQEICAILPKIVVAGQFSNEICGVHQPRITRKARQNSWKKRSHEAPEKQEQSIYPISWLSWFLWLKKIEKFLWKEERDMLLEIRGVLNEAQLNKIHEVLLNVKCDSMAYHIAL